MNARNFFAATDDGLKRNQYGAAVGGPVIKNKTFFFFSWQGTELRQRPPTSDHDRAYRGAAAGRFFQHAAARN